MSFPDNCARTRVLVVGGVWPHFRASREAANVVEYQIVRELARRDQYEVSVLCVNHRPVDLPADAAPDIAELKDLGVRFFDQLLLPPESAKRTVWRTMLAVAADKRHLLPGWNRRVAVRQHLGEYVPDIALTVWTEVGTRIVDGVFDHTIAYYGNVDHKVLNAGWLIEDLSGVRKPLLTKLKQRLLYLLYRDAHLKVMRRLDWVFDVAANDAGYYRSHGVNASYVPMTWNGNIRTDWEVVRDNIEIFEPIKIIGSVGNQGATGNSLAFIALVNEVLPALKQILGVGRFEIHLYGGGSPRNDGIRALLDDPHIIFRGFVDDLEREILSAPVVLVAHNWFDFKVSHTRILHSWSLGSFVVAHRDMALSMPEVVDNVNALLCSNGIEFAEKISAGINDRALRRRLGAGGIETLKTKNGSGHLVDHMQLKITEVLTTDSR